MKERVGHDYSTVKLPNNLIARIDKVLEKNGYTSRADFVKESCRRRLEEIEHGSIRREKSVYARLHRIEKMLSSIRKRT